MENEIDRENIIKEFEKKVKSDEKVIGLFGDWGIGKSYLLDQFQNKYEESDGKKTIFIKINAWSANVDDGLLEYIIYKIFYEIQYDNLIRNDIKAISINLLDKALDFLSEKYIGISISDIKEKYEGLSHSEYKEILQKYFTQVSEIEILLNNLPDKDYTFIVLLDELDRCDPKEAYKVLKSIKNIFNTSRNNIKFVVAVNPEPIIMAVKHEMGLSQYESKLVLEKYFDSYVDISHNNDIAKYINGLFKFKEKDQKDVKYYFTKSENINYKSHNYVDNLSSLQPYYTNLRVLQKSICNTNNIHLSLFLFHFNILKHYNANMYKNLLYISDTLLDIINTYQFNDNMEEKGKTYFSQFRTHFYEKLETKEAEGYNGFNYNQKSILENLLKNHLLIEFFINMFFPLTKVNNLEENFYNFLKGEYKNDKKVT